MISNNKILLAAFHKENACKHKMTFIVTLVQMNRGALSIANAKKTKTIATCGGNISTLKICALHFALLNENVGIKGTGEKEQQKRSEIILKRTPC